MRVLLVIALILAPALALGAGNSTNDSYNRAKKTLERRVYYDHRVTLYCGAEYNVKNEITPPPGFETGVHLSRVKKVEWEHAVPAENFGRAFSEWREGHPLCVHNGQPFKGRKCAEKVNLTYRYMQSDMHNLFPSIGSVNAARGNRQFAALPGEKPDFGSCEAKVKDSRFEPPDRAKGVVARASLYMEDNYPQYRISDRQRRLFESWDKMYPVTDWECERARRIERLQGNANERVNGACKKAGK